MCQAKKAERLKVWREYRIQFCQFADKNISIHGIFPMQLVMFKYSYEYT